MADDDTDVLPAVESAADEFRQHMKQGLWRPVVLVYHSTYDKDAGRPAKPKDEDSQPISSEEIESQDSINDGKVSTHQFADMSDASQTTVSRYRRMYCKAYQYDCEQVAAGKVALFGFMAESDCKPGDYPELELFGDTGDSDDDKKRRKLWHRFYGEVKAGQKAEVPQDNSDDEKQTEQQERTPAKRQAAQRKSTPKPNPIETAVNSMAQSYREPLETWSSQLETYFADDELMQDDSAIQVLREIARAARELAEQIEDQIGPEIPDTPAELLTETTE